MPRGRKPKTVTDDLTFGKRAQKTNKKIKEESQVLVQETLEKAEIDTVVFEQEVVAESEKPSEPEELKTLVVSGIDFTKVVKEVLYLGKLGAKLKPKKMPKINSLPYQIQFEVPSSGYDKYLNRVDEVKWDASIEYNKSTISTPDPIAFINKLLELGSSGAVIPDNKVVKSGKINQASVYTRVPVDKQPSVIPLPQKPLKYSEEELASFKMNDLQSIGKQYSVSSRTKAELISLILEAQKGE